MHFSSPPSCVRATAQCALFLLALNAVAELPTSSTTPAAPIGIESRPGLKFGFSTLGCPELDPAGVRALAAKHHSRYIEIRTLGGTTDFVSELAKFPGGAAGVRDFLLEADVRVRLVASSFQLTRSTVAQRAALVAEAEAGEALGAKWVRVFGGGKWGDPLTPEGAATARAHRAWWNELRAARGWTIDLLLETHDGLSASGPILELMEQSGGPMPILWDTHHTWKIGGESAATTWARIGHLVRHVNVKDSISQPSDKLPYTYVAQGHGEFPTQATLALLDAAHFDGVITFEWEKQWHPTLASLDTVLPDWNRATSAFRRPSPSPASKQPELLLKYDFDPAQIVPSSGPYFHGAREQYENIIGTGPTSMGSSLGEPTPAHPRIAPLRIYYEGGNSDQRSARIVPDETNSKNHVLRFRLTEPNVVINWPDGPQRKSRVQAELYGNIELRELFQTVRVRLPPDFAKLRNYPKKFSWFTLMEFWNDAGWVGSTFPFRFSFGIRKPEEAPGTNLYFHVNSQEQIDERHYRGVWNQKNDSFPVPIGTWFTLELYFKEGNANTGRFYVAIIPQDGSRTVLFDIKGATHYPSDPEPNGLTQFNPLKLYTSAEIVEFMKASGSALEVDWDDLQLWQGRTPETKLTP